MAQGYSLKDQLFNLEKTRYLAGLFASVHSGFDAQAFEAHVMAELPSLELKQRIAWIADCLGEAFPGDLSEVAPVILRALPPPLDPTLKDGDFGDFIFAPVGEWVAARASDHPELALDLFEELTQRFSMEWAIRPLLNRSPDLVLARMEEWCGHPSYHVRRLVSEGTRPRLPWGMSVSLGLADPLRLLDRLHADETRYVTRSVSNHLNDIARKDPDLVFSRLDQWRQEGRQYPDELRWMMSHALRGLVKSGHPAALRMLGYDPDAALAVTLDLPAAARIGGTLDFSVQVEGSEGQPVLVDYIVYFQRPGGKTSRKVHKLKQAVVGDGPLHLAKRHKLKGGATTFRLVPGPHRLEVQVNGRVRAAGGFELLE